MHSKGSAQVAGELPGPDLTGVPALRHSQRQGGAVPRYVSIAARLRGRITEHGEFSPGERLPSEAELARHYRVSRITIRQALAVLESDALIDRRHGAGTFVRPPRYRRADTRLTGLQEEFASAGLPLTTRVLNMSVVQAPPPVTSALELPPGTLCHYFERVRITGDRPIAYQQSYIVKALTPDLDRAALEARSFYTIVEQEYHLKLDFAEQTIVAEAADARIAYLLRVSEGSPLLRSRRLSWLVGGRPIEYVISYYPHDAVACTFTLRRNATSANTGPLTQSDGPLVQVLAARAGDE